MSTEATVKINVEEGSGKATLKDLRKEVELLDNSVEKTNDDFVQGQQEVQKSTISLKTQLKNLKDEMVQLDHNSPEFKQMALEAGAMEDKIKDVDAQVRILSSDTKGLDALVGAGQAIGGAFQASQGAMALFGQENEKVQKAIQNVIAVQGIMNGVMTVSNAIRKESVVGQKLLALWSGIVTTAQWLWNVAVTANPIGLIVVGVASLIAGIVLLALNIEKIIKSFDEWKKYLLLLLGPIGWVILAMELMKEKEESLEESQARRRKEENKRHKAQLKEIDKLRKEEAKAHGAKIKAIDLEIDRLEAEGKSSFALKLQRLEDIRDEEKAILASNNEKLQSWIDHYKNLAKIQGQSEEEFLATAKQQGVDLLDLQRQIEENQLAQKQKIFASETEILALKREHREKNKKEDKKASDDKVDNKDKETQKLLEAEQRQLEALRSEIEKAENEFYDSQLTAQQREVNAVEDKYFRLIELAKENQIEEAVLEEARLSELQEINDKFAEEKKAKDKEIADEEKATAETIQQQKIDRVEELASKANEIISIASNLQELVNTKELKRIKEKQKAGEELSKAEIKRLINDEKQKRAIAVAEIAIQTAVGVAKAVSAGAGLLFPANIPAIISGVGAVLSGVASASKILNAPLPSFDSPRTSGGSDSLGGGLSESAPNINANQNGSTILNEPPTQVVVLESDITSVQNNVSVIEQQATI